LVRALKKLSSPLLEAGSVLIFVRNLDQDLFEAKSDLELELRLATPSDFALSPEGYDRYRSVDMLEDRFKLGDLCFLAIDGEGKVAHSRWVTTGLREIPELGMEVMLWPGEAYFYDGYTRPDLRGHGIDAVVRCSIFRRLRSTGYKRAYSYVRGDNPVGLRAARRWQHPIGRLWYLRPRGLRPLVIGRRTPELPFLIRASAAGLEGEGKLVCTKNARAWFESWLREPLSKRSTGFDALPEAHFVSTSEFISEALRLNPRRDFVLDVGCDSAMVSRLVALRCRRFVGADFIPGLLADIPHGAVKSASGRPASFVAANGRFLPFRSHTFTRVYCSGVIHTLATHDDGIKMVNELLRVCRPGGEVLVASIPDTGKRLLALVDIWRRAGIRGKLRLLVSLAVPRPAKQILRRLLGLTRRDQLVLLDYDLRKLKELLGTHGLDCQILNFPESYWSRDFRRTRSNLLIRVPPQDSPLADVKQPGLQTKRSWVQAAKGDQPAGRL